MSAKQNITKQQQPGRRLLAVIIVLIAVNIAAWFFYTQVDLTKDKRYTITTATRQMLQHIDGKVEVLVFLDGEDLPAPFQRLANSTVDMLRQFRDISDNKVVYRVVDPLGQDTTALNILRQYRMSGIPVSLSAGKKGTTQKMIFPWALITMVDAQGRSLAYPVFLQETNTRNLNRQTLLKSEILLEYNLANGIHRLTMKELPAVAYLMGNGEQLDPYVLTAISTLQQSYRFDTLNINQVAAIPAVYKTVLINRPMIPFTEKEKFKIDQYVMNGGNLFWSINMVTGTLDSLRSGQFNAMPIDLNLNDLLFHYGVRINPNLIEDAVSSAFIPLQARSQNSEASMRPWVYFPILMPGNDHPLVKNLNGILTRFASSIDTNTNDPAIKKTVLLSSSKYSKTEAAPLPVIIESAMEDVNPATFLQQNLIGAILLEGRFTSAYATRRPVEVADMMDSLKLKLKATAVKPGKMIITGDADILANEFSPKEGPFEMGVFLYDPNTKFDNKSFLLNSMEYMNDDENLLEARNKNFDNRILDPKVVEKERSTWQFINIGIPVLAILIFGSVFFFVRKKRYA